MGKPRLPMNDDFPPEFFEKLAWVVIEFGRLERGVMLAIKSIYVATGQAEKYEGGLWQAVQDESFSDRLAHLCKEFVAAYGNNAETQTIVSRVHALGAAW